MLRVWRWVGIGVVAGLTFVGLVGAAAANPSTEEQFFSQINASRASAGLPALTMDADLRAYARTHSQFMADGNCPPPATICHSTSAQLQAAAGHGWSALGENVGRGNKDTLHNTFMGSEPHRKNILGDYNFVGIGTVFANDSTYVTVVFMKKGATASPSPTTTTTTKPATTTTKPAATTTTAPTTTTTTVPTTTTTTLVVGPDRPVTPGASCHTVTRFWWVCQD